MGIEVFARVKGGQLSNVNNYNNHSTIKFDYQKNKYDYTINKIWNNYEKNDVIYEHIMRNNDNYNNLYYAAFGYTGSGKTYTIFNMLELFLKNLLNDNTDTQVELTAYQIYCEKIYDMLNHNKKLKIFKTNKLIIQKLTKKKIKSSHHIIEMIKKNRQMASTNMNKVSSRSHAIIEIYCGKKKYTFIDMAGQESGVTSNMNNKIVQKQGKNINLNMLALKECIRLHHDKNKHIPFRRSLLTLALKPLFTQHCYVAFICTVCAKQKDFFKLDSIRYASALYDKKTLEKDNNINNLFKFYTDYVQESGWIAIKERELWRKTRNTDLTKLPKILTYMKKRTKLILWFSKILVKHKNTIPALSKSVSKNIDNIEKNMEARDINLNDEININPSKKKHPIDNVKKNGYKYRIQENS